MPEREPEIADLFWDAAVDAREVRRVLREGDDLSRRSVVRRLLEFGEWDEIRAFLTLDDIERDLPYLGFRSGETASFWKEALAVWRAQRR